MKISAALSQFQWHSLINITNRQSVSQQPSEHVCIFTQRESKWDDDKLCEGNKQTCHIMMSQRALFYWFFRLYIVNDNDDDFKFINLHHSAFSRWKIFFFFLHFASHFIITHSIKEEFFWFSSTKLHEQQQRRRWQVVRTHFF